MRWTWIDRFVAFVKELQGDYPGEIEMSLYQERGIDVLPGGTQTFKLDWKVGESNLRLTADPKDFQVSSSVPHGGQDGKPSFRQDTLYWPAGKADAQKFYIWLADGGEQKVKKLDIMGLRDLWRSLGVRYDYH